MIKYNYDNMGKAWKKPYKEIENDLTTNTYTTIFAEEQYCNNAPHRYSIVDSRKVRSGLDGVELTLIKFQEGSMKENDLNGIFMEDLMAICIDRLNHFQQSDFKCRENAVAITKLEESLMWLRKRTLNREKRGVQGKMEV